MTEVAIPPDVWQYSVKLETIQKGTNTTVHGYGNDPDAVRIRVIDLLINVRKSLEDNGLKPTPFEVIPPR